MDMKTKPRYDLLLFGKTGGGKSSTGNSILGRKEFPTSSSASSVTYVSQCGLVERPDCHVKVIDGPGTSETRLNKSEAVDKVVEDISEAMVHLTEGFNAVIFVFRFGTRFTKEEQDSIDLLKKILGEDVFQRFGIIVLTRGDYFKSSMEEEGTPDSSPLDWCTSQDSNLNKFVSECGSRVILFNNRSKDEQEKHEQVEQLIEVVRKLPNRGERYTNKMFQEMHKAYEKHMMDAQLPQLLEEFSIKRTMLIAALDSIDINSSHANEQISKAKELAYDLVVEISKKDKGTGMLSTFKESIEGILSAIDAFGDRPKAVMNSFPQSKIEDTRQSSLSAEKVHESADFLEGRAIDAFDEKPREVMHSFPQGKHGHPCQSPSRTESVHQPTKYLNPKGYAPLQDTWNGKGCDNSSINVLSMALEDPHHPTAYQQQNEQHMKALMNENAELKKNLKCSIDEYKKMERQLKEYNGQMKIRDHLKGIAKNIINAILQPFRR